jgi:hypothetical protein
MVISEMADLSFTTVTLMFRECVFLTAAVKDTEQLPVSRTHPP